MKSNRVHYTDYKPSNCFNATQLGYKPKQNASIIGFGLILLIMKLLNGLKLGANNETQY